MRACANTKCVAFGRIVYSVATRCPLCKWDLKGSLPVSEVGAEGTEKGGPRASNLRPQTSDLGPQV